MAGGQGRLGVCHHSAGVSPTPSQKHLLHQGFSQVQSFASTGLAGTCSQRRPAPTSLSPQCTGVGPHSPNLAPTRCSHHSCPLVRRSLHQPSCTSSVAPVPFPQTQTSSSAWEQIMTLWHPASTPALTVCGPACGPHPRKTCRRWPPPQSLLPSDTVVLPLGSQSPSSVDGVEVRKGAVHSASIRKLSGQGHCALAAPAQARWRMGG